MSAFADREVTLIARDGEEFKVSLAGAKLSGMVANALSDDDSDEERSVQLPLVDKASLERVVSFVNHYLNERMTDFAKPLASAELSELVQPFYANFVTTLDQKALFDLTLAANFMDIKPLLDLCCARIASFIKNKTPEQIRTNLNIPNDFTPEEEAAVKAENKWAEDL